MAGTKYDIPRFIADAKAILASRETLEGQQLAIGERLSELSRRDDLTRHGMPLGPSDASTENYILWREPPYLALVLGQFDPGYLSPVHEHKDFWVVGCGYRGEDRWDMYERLDDGRTPGHAEVRLVDQWHIPRGKAVCMPMPPRAIHSHNNVSSALVQELIFSAAKPLPPDDRIVYDVDNKTCRPSGFNLSGILVGDYYPPRPVASIAQAVRRSFVAGASQALAGLAGLAAANPGVAMRAAVSAGATPPGGFKPGGLFGRRSKKGFCPVCACFA